MPAFRMPCMRASCILFTWKPSTLIGAECKQSHWLANRFLLTESNVPDKEDSSVQWMTTALVLLFLNALCQAASMLLYAMVRTVRIDDLMTYISLCTDVLSREEGGREFSGDPRWFQHNFGTKNRQKIETFSTQKFGKKWDQSGRKSSLKNRNNLGTKIRKNYCQSPRKNYPSRRKSYPRRKSCPPRRKTIF